MIDLLKIRTAALLALLGAVALLAGPAAAQEPVSLSLTEALERAAGGSEQVAIARAGVVQAEGNVVRARAARLPQLNATASYQRALASQFEGGFGGGSQDSVVVPPRCQLDPDPTLPLDERVRILEGRLNCPLGSSPFGDLDFGNLGFGAKNTYNLGLSFSWALYTGGRLDAQRNIARSAREVAEIGLISAGAQMRLDVTQAYYDAQLADQMVAIARATLEQADETLRLTELGVRVGQQAEFDALRARVARDNQRAPLIQAGSQRDLAYDRLRLLLDLPMDAPLNLTSALDAIAPSTVGVDTAVVRAPVRQAAEQVEVQANQLRIARAQRLPSVRLISQYGQIAFAENVFPEFGNFRDNWTVSAAVSVPVFTGGRIRGDVLGAEASVAQARAQFRQAEELVLLDTRNALAQLRAARAIWEASEGTVDVAERAYGIAELRYKEGISNLLELNDARLLLQQAQTNRASAARNFQVAETRVELLPYLPVSTFSGIGPGANSGVPNGAGTSRAAETQPPQQQGPAAGLGGATQGSGSPQGQGSGFP